MHGMAFRYQMCPRHAISNYSATVYLRGGKVYMPSQGPCAGFYGTDACAMVVAEEMGARWEDVVILYDMNALFTAVGGGSDGTTSGAWVMKEAAVACKKQVLEAAAPILKAKPEELDTKDSMIFVKSDPSRSIPFARIEPPIAINIQGAIAASVNGRAPRPIWSWMGKKLDTMNTLYCEVAVDTETGEVEVLRYGVAADPGKILRPTSLESQIQQTMMFTTGSQLSEELVWDRATGVRLNANMFDYKKPTILDIAPTEMELLETRAGNAAYGASGISHSLANTHVIVCAIQNAIGKWVDPPATPDKVLKVLGKA
jgi:xanthine dehydrogenase molybdenum-binding subunit